MTILGQPINRKLWTFTAIIVAGVGWSTFAVLVARALSPG